jgi:hypothetical protein
MSFYSVLISGLELAKHTVFGRNDLCLSFIHITVFTAPHTGNNVRFMFSQKDKKKIDLEVFLGQPSSAPLHAHLFIFDSCLDRNPDSFRRNGNLTIFFLT